MQFTPINGQSVIVYGKLRLGWCRLRTNGCAVVAIYNALGLLGCAMPLDEILRAFHAWYRPHFFGIWPRRIRAFFRRQGIPFCRTKVDWNNGDVAILTYWNRCFGKKIVNPFGGAHTVCIRCDSGFWVYNRFSNCTKTCRYDTLEELLEGRKLIQSLHILNSGL